MNKYLISICIPTYNRKALLKRALDSILGQMDDRVEILVSDNASDDGTREMMRDEYPNIRYSRNEQNVGGEANFLKCCELAQGRFFILFGSDDVLVEGALNKIINFLEMNDGCSLVFMNHAFFSGNYIDLEHCSRKWLNEFESLTTSNKSIFINYAKNQISFMTCLIFSKEAYKTVQNPEQYNWTYFLHTNIVFEVAKGVNSTFGIIGNICIADNISDGESTVESNNMRIFEIFGRGMEWSFCTHAVNCGFDAEQMKKIYFNYAKSGMPRAIIKNKVYNRYDWKSDYKEYLLPILKKYPKLYIYIVPFYLIPSWLAKFIRKYIRPIYKKLKSRL